MISCVKPMCGERIHAIGIALINSKDNDLLLLIYFINILNML